MWERVRTQGGVEGWIKQADISEDDGTPVKNIVYDRWDRFFTLIDLCKYGKYRCEKKDDFLKEFGLRLGESGKVSEAMKGHKELLLPVYYKKESEWLDSDEHTNALIGKYKMVRDAIMQERTDCEFWDGLNEKLPRECYYFNPKGFLNHLDKVAGVPEFNPYEDNTDDLPTIVGEETKCEVRSNPGFAPYTGQEKYHGYASITGHFNDDYGLYYHEGTDFAGECGKTPVKALVSGKVVLAEDHGESHYGLSLLIKGDRQEDGKNLFYLLGHLSRYEPGIGEGSTVSPGQTVGYVGNTGNCYTAGHKVSHEERAAGMGAHLHVSVYKTGKTKGEDLFTDTYITKYKVNDKWKSDMVNPFDHKIERRF